MCSDKHDAVEGGFSCVAVLQEVKELADLKLSGAADAQLRVSTVSVRRSVTSVKERVVYSTCLVQLVLYV